MSKFRDVYSCASAVLLVSLTLLTPVALAQQDQIPPQPAESPAGAVENTESGESDRIVEDRPALYGLRRGIHPISWLQAGVGPLLGAIEGAGLNGVTGEKKSSRVSGVKFGLQSLGLNSAFGPEVKPFHKNLFNKGIEVEIPLVVTYKWYQSFGFRANYPLISNGSVERLGIEFTGEYLSRPTDRFFGIGNDSLKENQALFRSVTRTAGVALETRVNPVWTLRLESAFRSFGVTRPSSTSFPPAMEVFSPVRIPGLTIDPGVRMLTGGAVVQRNTTDQPHIPASGGVQRFEVSLNEGISGGDFSYWRYRADVRQFFPLSEDRRKVLALRARVETVQEKGGSAVPFLDLPLIGSRSTVRGFDSRRFVDGSAMNLSLEYRYRIYRHFDWAVFVDTGQVAHEIGDFGWNRFHTGYGMRFIARAGKNAFSIDVARSPETWKVYLDFTPTF